MLAAQGGLDLPLLQRFINFWVSESYDLFGSPDSSNAATYFAAGLKGRYQESKAGTYSDHELLDGTHPVERPAEDGGIEVAAVPLRRAANALLAEAYARECEKTLARWNQTLQNAELDYRLSLPSPRFNRKIGPFQGAPYLPDGRPAGDADELAAHLPSDDDRAYLESLQTRAVLKRGEQAHWIGPPTNSINRQPLDFEYVRA